MKSGLESSQRMELTNSKEKEMEIMMSSKMMSNMKIRTLGWTVSSTHSQINHLIYKKNQVMTMVPNLTK